MCVYRYNIDISVNIRKTQGGIYTDLNPSEEQDTDLVMVCYASKTSIGHHLVRKSSLTLPSCERGCL